MMKSGSLFRVALISLSISLIVAPLKYFNLPSCLLILRSSSHIPEIIKSSVIASVNFGYYLLLLSYCCHFFLTKSTIGSLDFWLVSCFKVFFMLNRLHMIFLSYFTELVWKRLLGIKCSKFSSVLLSMLMVVKVGGDLVDFKVIESYWIYTGL